MRLRPHHLLCTQSYRGKGYSEAFVENMDNVVHRLRTETRTSVDITFSTDSLCACCPNMLGQDQCISQEKVKQMDSKIINALHLEEKTYIYQELIQEIQDTITPEDLTDICSGCQWYEDSGSLIHQSLRNCICTAKTINSYTNVPM